MSTSRLDKIVNPDTGRKVNLYSKLGKSILHRYLINFDTSSGIDSLRGGRPFSLRKAIGRSIGKVKKTLSLPKGTKTIQGIEGKWKSSMGHKWEHAKNLMVVKSRKYGEPSIGYEEMKGDMKELENMAKELKEFDTWATETADKIYKGYSKDTKVNLVRYSTLHEYDAFQNTEHKGEANKERYLNNNTNHMHEKKMIDLIANDYYSSVYPEWRKVNLPMVNKFLNETRNKKILSTKGLLLFLKKDTVADLQELASECAKIATKVVELGSDGLFPLPLNLPSITKQNPARFVEKIDATLKLINSFEDKLKHIDSRIKSVKKGELKGILFEEIIKNNYYYQQFLSYLNEVAPPNTLSENPYEELMLLGNDILTRATLKQNLNSVKKNLVKLTK
jgi:hypothetical protein